MPSTLETNLSIKVNCDHARKIRHTGLLYNIRCVRALDIQACG